MPELFNVLPVAEAEQRLAQHIAAFGHVERVPLFHAAGRVVAEPIQAPESLPAFARSTMDGFAVRAADTYGASEGLPAYLTLIGEVPMGQPSGISLGAGETARVHTGGMLPDGCDAVVMVEHTQQLDATMIEILRPVAVGDNTVPVGGDVRAGTPVFRAGWKLRPQDLGGLAALGITMVPVFPQPRVAILATGDEVVGPHDTPTPGQIRDVNSSTVAALVRQHGGIPQPIGIAPDDAAALERLARAALAQADVLVISAGSSVSTRDVTASVISKLGKPGVLVHGVSMHPGKPTILAMAGSKPVFGLPGNPVSTMVAFHLFVMPTLLRLQGLEPVTQRRNTVTARLLHNLASHPGSEDFVPVRLVDRAGEQCADPVFGKSNLIFTMVRADGLVRVPADRAGLYADDMVTVELF